MTPTNSSASSATACIPHRRCEPDEARGIVGVLMITVLTIVLAVLLVITSALLIVLILLHRGKGGGLSDLFGGGVSSSIGGSSVAEKNLDRLTVGIGLIWAASIVGVGLIIST